MTNEAVKKFFHEIPQSEIEAFPDHMTWGDINAKYKQPDWCNYHEALMGVLGCMSLCDLSKDGNRSKISNEWCLSCPECKNSTYHPTKSTN